MHFDPETRTTDMMMFNSRNLGALIVAEEPHVKSWEDGQYNIMNMSIEETYEFGILQEGQAIAVAKNIKVRPNEFTMPARTVFTPGLSVPGHNQALAHAREDGDRCRCRRRSLSRLRQQPAGFSSGGSLRLHVAVSPSTVNWAGAQAMGLS